MYDPLLTDEPILQELFLQEILNAEMDGGLCTALLSSAALLAGFKNAENVWLLRERSAQTSIQHVDLTTGFARTLTVAISLLGDFLLGALMTASSNI